MSSSTEPTNEALLVKLANDYSSYVHADLFHEVSRLDEYMQECIAKMDELGELFDRTEDEQKDWCVTTLPALLEHTLCLNDVLSKRLEELKTTIASTRESLDRVEEQISQMNEGDSMGAPSSLRSVLNYFKKAEPLPQDAPVAKPAWNR